MQIVDHTLLSYRGVYRHGDTAWTLPDPADLESLYTFLRMDYPRFFKMDPLAMLGAVLSQELAAGKTWDARTGIVVGNKHSSYRADIRHLENMKQQVPGPANFTYTLPNIALGEMAIRFGWKGETAVWVSEQPDFIRMEQLLRSNMELTGATDMLAGWMDAGPEGTAGFLCHVTAGGISSGGFAEAAGRCYKLLFL